MIQNSLDSIRSVIGQINVLTDADSLEKFSFDALNPFRVKEAPNLPDRRVSAVLRPGSTVDVSSIVKWARLRGIGLIPYGGGTGVMGGVIPASTSVALDVTRMDQILEMDRSKRMARVQPGVILEDLAFAAEQNNLLFGHDPWSRPVATVGGALSTDGIGYLASRYGSMGDQVMALEAVIADGSIIRTRPLVRQSSGPQLNGIFVGSEGTMGVITEVTVQMFPVPERRKFMTLGFASFDDGFRVVCDLFDTGLVPTLMDLTEEEPRIGAHGYRTILYLGFDGPLSVVDAQVDYALMKTIESNGVDLGPGLTEQYWITRHASGYRWRNSMQMLLPSKRWTLGHWGTREYLHVALPVSAILEYKSFAEGIVKLYGLNIIESAVWTDPGLFSLLIEVNGRHPTDQELRMANAVNLLLDGVLDRGGGIEYCHGMGSKLLGWKEKEWGDSVGLVRAIKSGLDADDTFNPGKITLQENL